MSRTEGGFGLPRTRFARLTRRAALTATGAVLASALLAPGVAHAYTGYTVSWAGDNTYGQANVPSALFAGATDISAGYYHALAVKNGGVLAWGRNYAGESTVPAAATTGVTKVAAGFGHSLALKNGGVIAWGNNTAGEATVPVAATSGVVAIAAGAQFSAALKSNGTVVTWGQGTTAPSVSNVKAISAGFHHLLMVKNDGTVVDWLYNGWSSVPNTTGLPITAVAAGWTSHIAMSADGHAFVWDVSTAATRPMPATFGANVRAVAIGAAYATVTHTNGGIEVVRLEDQFSVTPPTALQSGVDRAVMSVEPTNLWIVAVK
ncbi:hypothetical protein L6E12_25365 [Actinokineospora sp. PR83]|uniref:RCC1 domain-containing protein n=1 Tax=Actinokineospora sp. PR83 TaxID=2884908 RepID=UPI001F29D190|nr:hypothetical protein [Actinokineospora sp. PR83]MCG8919113.1 hypothetical protein [Actinokineospora sp. PR83]